MLLADRGCGLEKPKKGLISRTVADPEPRLESEPGSSEPLAQKASAIIALSAEWFSAPRKTSRSGGKNKALLGKVIVGSCGDTLQPESVLELLKVERGKRKKPLSSASGMTASRNY